MPTDPYDNPLMSRYASREMAALWSNRRRALEWRRLWILLAETQRDLGLPIEQSQIDEMRRTMDQIDWDVAERWERELRHDVMAHIHTFGEVCPSARPILHWGATSCYVTDNTDLILMRDGLQLLLHRLVRVIDRLAEFAERYRQQACLAFTHLQSAQPTTVGKRACLWCQDLCLDVAEMEHRLAHLRARSAKGTTGTQASFLKLFGGDHDKVRQMDQRIAKAMGFEDSYTVTGQTYPRKVDTQVLSALSGVAQSAHKAACDIRLLASRQELEEPFESGQVGSSAMAYKRNPMRSERICGLARFVMSLVTNAAETASQQWMERTLDDSANRRLILPQAFLATDAILLLYDNVVSGLTVYPHVIQRHLDAELPFLATEDLLMAAVERGADRQTAHEVIRKHSQDVARDMKQHGSANDLFARLAGEPLFAGLVTQSAIPAERYIGRAAEQVDEFLAESVAPLRRRYAEVLQAPAAAEVRV